MYVHDALVNTYIIQNSLSNYKTKDKTVLSFPTVHPFTEVWRSNSVLRQWSYIPFTNTRQIDCSQGESILTHSHISFVTQAGHSQSNLLSLHTDYQLTRHKKCLYFLFPAGQNTCLGKCGYILRQLDNKEWCPTRLCIGTTAIQISFLTSSVMGLHNLINLCNAHYYTVC